MGFTLQFGLLAESISNKRIQEILQIVKENKAGKHEGKLWRATKKGILNQGKTLVPEIESNEKIPSENKEEIRKLPIPYQESVVHESLTMDSKSFKIFVRDRIYEIMNIPKERVLTT